MGSTGGETIGLVFLFVLIPLHTISLIWFSLRRHIFPISGRHPLLALFLMTLATAPTIYLSYILWSPDSETPCWVSWYVLGPFTLAFLPITTIRATLLLCQVHLHTTPPPSFRSLICGTCVLIYDLVGLQNSLRYIVHTNHIARPRMRQTCECHLLMCFVVLQIDNK
jgi:hypothetical protein